MSKIFTTIIIISVVIQISFSFFYSSNIVTQNSQLDVQQTELNQLKLDVQQIEKQMVNLTSIKNLNDSTASAKFRPINQFINLNY